MEKESCIQNIQQSSAMESDHQYRLKQKTFYCHQCRKQFKKIAPTNENIEIQCSTCNNDFCEEIENSSLASPNHPIHFYENRAASPETHSVHEDSSIFNQSRQSAPNNQNQRRNIQQIIIEEFTLPQNQQNVYIQRTTSFPFANDMYNHQGNLDQERVGASRESELLRNMQMNSGNQRRPINHIQRTIIFSNNSQQDEMDERPEIFIQNEMPVFSFLPGLSFNNLVTDNFFGQMFNRNLNSHLNNELLQQIIRLSEQERGRMGTPPASKEVIDNLVEVDLPEQSQNQECVSCSICQEEVKNKGIMLPCKHFYHKDCIVQWLNIHNQCPTCRFELKTDDAEYERQKHQHQEKNSENSQTQ